MKSIGMRELKANLSEILREVGEDGQVVEVTRHGRVVARLVPPKQSGRTGMPTEPGPICERSPRRSAPSGRRV
jgi:prevent-host-death family protein